jgi:hypothetical protein
MDMIQLYKLRGEIDNKCPSCGRKLALYPLSNKIEDKELHKTWSIENL